MIFDIAQAVDIHIDAAIQICIEIRFISVAIAFSIGIHIINNIRN